MSKEKQIEEAIENLKYLISCDCTGNQMDFVEGRKRGQNEI